MKLKDKEKRAIEVLKAFQPQSEPYYLCYSGGKDSDVIKILATLSGVDYEAVHNLTTVDAPETVNYIKSQSDVRIDRPELSMWQLIIKKKMPPTRIVRYCCSELKERGGQGRMKITGVRWAESPKRKSTRGVVDISNPTKKTLEQFDDKEVDYTLNQFGGIVLNDDNSNTRDAVESCYRTRSVMVNPIVDWTDEDVWEFLHHYGCESNPLYQCGYTRIGCIGCPLGGRKSQEREFARYPKYKANYIRTFDKMVRARIQEGKPTKWNNGYETYKWWLGYDVNQLTMFEIDDYNRILEEMGVT